MKTSAVLASMLFGSLAVAAPFDKRALAYKTEVVTETVVVWTTVYDDGAEVAEATTTPAGYFYEQPKASSAAAVPTSAQAPAAPPVVEKPSSAAYVAPAPQTPTPTPAPAPTPTPAPVEQPKPETSAYVAPAPAPAPASSAAYVAPAPAPASSAAYVAPAPAASSPAPQTVNTASSSGAQFQDVDITIYDNNQGGFGACGTKLTDSDMIVALAQPAWGASTYDKMTGAATNPWCGQKIKVEYEGKSVEATIMDMCPGCAGHDIDLSVAAWKALTGSDVKTRYKASWSKIS